MSAGLRRTSLRVNNDLSVDEFVRLAGLAQASGFDQLWLSHDLFMRSAPVLLGLLSRETTTLKIGAGILNPYSQHPVELAMTAATLQEASEGRFLLGIGSGAADMLAWAGIKRPRPLTRIRSTIVTLRALLAGRSPADVPGADAGWLPEGRLRVPAVPTPIYLGAMSPRMLGLGGQLADGVLALLFPPEHYATARRHVGAGLLSRSADLGPVDLPACVWCSLDDDPVRARAALVRKLAYYGPSMAPSLLAAAGLAATDFLPLRRALEDDDEAALHALASPRMLSLGIAGDVDAVVDRCRPLVELGAEHLSFGPPLGPDLFAAVEALGRKVLPALRGDRRDGG